MNIIRNITSRIIGFKVNIDRQTDRQIYIYLTKKNCKHILQNNNKINDKETHKICSVAIVGATSMSFNSYRPMYKTLQ